MRAGSAVGSALCALLVTLGASVAGAREPQAAADSDDWLEGKEVLFVARAAREAPLRSGPDPHFGQVRRAEPGEWFVVIGRRSGFAKVLVPRGFFAFVHGRYVEQRPDGSGRITAARVNVRSRPSSRGDYPIGRLEEDTVVRLVERAGEGGAWWRILAPLGLPLWIEEEALGAEEGGVDAPAVRAALDEERRLREERYEQAARARLEELAARRRMEEARRRELEQARALEERAVDVFALGLDGDPRPLLDEVRAALEAAETEEGRRALGALAERVEGYVGRWSAELERRRRLEALLEEVRRAEEESESVEPEASALPARGETLEGRGFVRLDGAPGGPAQVVLEAGRTVLMRLVSPDGRYRLSDFVGKAVRVRGRVVEARAGEPPVVEVARLEIVARPSGRELAHPP